VSARFVSQPMSLAGVGGEFYRADLVFHGLDHSGPSYEVRVFFNRPDADAETAITAEAGYVTSFFMFGHGGCAGQPGHCEVPESRRTFDRRPPHQLEPATRWVTVTDAVRRAVAAGDQLTVSAVSVMTTTLQTGASLAGDADLMALERLSLVTYD
jgi:hypothetical protein